MRHSMWWMTTYQPVGNSCKCTRANANALSLFFFFNGTATPSIYTLSLHDALPIFDPGAFISHAGGRSSLRSLNAWKRAVSRSEEHTSELQSRRDLVCRLLLEK